MHYGSAGGIRSRERWRDVCLWSVWRCRLHAPGDTRSDVNVLLCESQRKRKRESSGGKDGQIIPSAWWDWRLGLIDRLIIGGNEAENEWDSALGLLGSRAAGLQGMLAATLHGLNVHGTWFHLRLIYSYTIPTKWSNKKSKGEPGRGCKSSFIAGILLFHASWNWCSEKGERMKIQYELARVEDGRRKNKLWMRCGDDEDMKYLLTVPLDYIFSLLISFTLSSQYRADLFWEMCLQLGGRIRERSCAVVR